MSYTCRHPLHWGSCVGGAVVALAAAPALAGTMQYFDPDSAFFPDYGSGYNYWHIQAGEEYKSVGELEIYMGDTIQDLAVVGTGSGTLIHDPGDPNSVWVLTAAHVVDVATFLTFNLPTSETWENIGGTWFRSVEYQTYSATDWYVPDTWAGLNEEEDFFIGNDIAMVKLSASPVADGFTPHHFAEENPGEGTEFDIVGFGVTGDGYTGELVYTGHRRAGTNTLDFTMTSGAILLSDFDAPKGSAYDALVGTIDDWPASMEYSIASGDSGGPDLIGDVVFGVHSFGWGIADGAADASFLDLAGSTSTAAWYEWIIDVMNADRLGNMPPDALHGEFLDAILTSGGGGTVLDYRQDMSASLWSQLYEEFMQRLADGDPKAAEFIEWFNLQAELNKDGKYATFKGMFAGLGPDGQAHFVIPEPTSALALLGIGATGLILRRRR